MSRACTCKRFVWSGAQYTRLLLMHQRGIQSHTSQDILENIQRARAFKQIIHKNHDSSTENQLKGTILTKAIAQTGLCSRRQAEQMIKNGRVKLNGQIITQLQQINVRHDRVEIDEKPLALRPATRRLFIFNKPAQTICSFADPQGRKTVFQIIKEKNVFPNGVNKLITIGRLDYMSTGLLLLTSDDRLGLLAHPSLELPRKYLVRTVGEPNILRMDALTKHGANIDGLRYKSMQITPIKTQALNKIWEVTLFEGQNRELRRVFEWLGLSVNRLHRIAFGPYELSDKTNSGKLVEVKVHQELIELLDKNFKQENKDN